MQLYFKSGTCIAIVVALTAMLGHNASAQSAPASEGKGLPPRATPADYQAHAQAGTVTIAAEFAGHSIPDPQSALETEDYVVVEVGLFGPPEARLRLSPADFSLRINGKKTPLQAQAYALVFKSLKDPQYEPPVHADAKTKTSIGGDGKGQADPGALPPVVHIPIGVERAMEQRVQKASLPEGERPLPQAGLIFFEHRGKSNSIELIYTSPAGKATLTLQP
jgi:hypothetical protein